MLLSVPCSIKGCTHFVQVENDGIMFSRDFSLCYDCEAAVLIDTHIQMEREGEWPPDTAKAFAIVYNSWCRRRKGVALAHRPQDIGMVRPLVRPLGDSN